MSNLYVVGIGASAGGLEALENFFSNMPPTGSAAFVVVQHLSPDYKSHMAELLTKHTPMLVQEVEDRMPVEVDMIYLLPHRKNMLIQDGVLHLMDYDRERGLNLPIDIFFDSLAHDQGERAIGIVLSGTGSDGTRGIRAIKEMGGMIMAQDESARFDGMPRSAISTRLVDFIAPPQDMPTTLSNYIAHPDQRSKLRTTLPEDELSRLLTVVANRDGVDFSGYKPTTLLRRIERRMNINQIEEMQDYITFVRESEAESHTLYKEFLIGVTRFFRDPEVFEYMRVNILPELFRGRTRRDQIRVWVAGCSTGEEPYSLAILFQEYMEETGMVCDVKIFATDIDREALDYASRGIYPESIVGDVSQRRLHNYFVKKGDTYEVLRQIRHMVVFAHQNLLKDAPFSRIDLISCRNLLIYLDQPMQRRALGTFEFSLNAGCFLLLGNSETVGDMASTFSIEHNKWKLFRYVGGTKPRLESGHVIQRDAPAAVGTTPVPPRVDDWRGSDPVLRSLVEQVLPPTVVVDEQYVVIHSFGDVSDYLRAPSGFRVDLNILRMVREELSIPLSTALHRTLENGEPVTYRHVRLPDGSDINLSTRLFWQQNNRQRLVMVTFSENMPVESEAKNVQTFNLSQSARQRIQDLEQELQYSRENLQATIEELETSNEELQATNEELLAANEELQSTNEELQSVNEELMTVNTEYQAKIRELTALNDDVNNLLRTTDIGTLFLDANLYLRKFTVASQTVFSILDSDIGRPLEHLSHRMEDFDLTAAVREVLDHLRSTRHEVRTRDGNWFLLKINPYVTYSNVVNGVVINLVDLTEVEVAQQSLRESERLYRAIARSIPNGAIFLFDHDLRYLVVEGQELRRMGLNPEDYEGRLMREVARTEDIDMLETNFHKALAGETVSMEYDHPNGHTYMFHMGPVYSLEGEIYAGLLMSQRKD